MGKYLSATVVQEKLKELCEKYFVQYGSHYDSFGKAIAEFTDNLPTADVRENVHGEWITDTESALAGNICSACGKVANSIFHKTNFCPNCGADMRMDDET